MTVPTVFLAPGDLNHIANIVKGYAIAIGIVIAITFVWMWWKHRARERQVELSTRARAVYAAALRSGVQHPELAEPMLGVIASGAEFVRYKLYVASLLAAADEILLLDPSPEWKATIARLLTPHRSYLGSDEFRQGALADCTPALRQVLGSVIST